MSSEKKEKKGGSILVWILIIVFVFWLFGDDEDIDTEPIVNSSTDKYTLMVYMCGSDLESEGGYASDDIEEMMESELADEVNLLIYTGGAKNWYNENISGNKNQIFKLESGSLKLVNDGIGMRYLSNPNTLIDFLNWSKENYPADKYGLVFWDHGGGAVSGFGFDENDPDENESLTIDEIKYALDRFEPKLEFIGFDACVMGGFETAYAFKDQANYFIASEEVEPGSGWEYKKTLNQLSKNTSQSGEVLGKVVVDSFIKDNNWLFGADATLSVIDLSKMDNVYSNVMSFMNDINNADYSQVKRALSDSKAFADGEIDTVDLIDFSTKLNVNSSTNLNNAINDCVVYNKVTDYLEGANGMSFYFPNETLDNYEKMISIYQNIGLGSDYISIMNEYANVTAGGYSGFYRVNNNTYQTGEDYETYSWYDENLIDNYSDYYEYNEFDSDELEITEDGDSYVLKLSDEQWETIVDVGTSIWYDDGEGYIDLGIDSYVEYNDNGDLKIEFDGTWLAINGNIVRYEVCERTDRYEKGKVPALLNGEEVNLVLYWDQKHPDGQVLGAEPVNAYGNTTLIGKGYTEIKKGDEIAFLVDYYDYYGEYDDQYLYGDTIKVGSDGLKISYEYIGDGECVVYYVLTDIFNNVYFTEPLVVY